MKAKTIIAVIFFSFGLIGYQADVLAKERSPVDWGYVPPKILNRTALEGDTSAVACVVFDIGELTFGKTGLHPELNRHVRIQIFKEGGKEAADVKIPFWDTQKISKLKGQTILPNGETIELSKKNVYQEGIGDELHYKVFALPGVQDRCIIEYQYKLEIGAYYYLKPWFFQDDIHTELSRITFEIPEGFVYQTTLRNCPSSIGQPTEETSYKIETYKRYTWEFRDLPAYQPESFTVNPMQQLATLDFQLLRLGPYSYDHPWSFYKKVWYLVYEPYYEENDQIKKLAEKLLGQDRSFDRALTTFYRFVQDSITAAEYNGKGPESILKKRECCSREKNYLLASLLRAADIPADLLRISTLGNRKIDINHPRFWATNHSIVYVEHDEQEFFLDASNEYCPFGLLPPEDLVDVGLRVDDADTVQFINLPKSREVSMFSAYTTDGVLDETGALTARSTVRYEGYRNIEYREKLAQSESESLFVKKAVLDSALNISLKDFSIITGDNKRESLVVELEYTVPDYADMTGDMIYMPTVLLHRMSQNIFQAESREHPVEYVYPRCDYEEMSIQIPADYQVVEKPEEYNRITPGLQYTRTISQQDGALTFTRKFLIKETTFSPEEYQRLRSFYSSVVNADGDQIVLSAR